MLGAGRLLTLFSPFITTQNVFCGIRNVLRPATPGGRFPLVILIFLHCKGTKNSRNHQTFPKLFSQKVHKRDGSFCVLKVGMHSGSFCVKQSPGFLASPGDCCYL